jgi:hypothetical protein
MPPKFNQEREREMKQKIPMEWMGPPSWRLPSGKALAEFALQAGFLAPLLLGGGFGAPKATPVRPVKSRESLTKVPR